MYKCRLLLKVFFTGSDGSVTFDVVPEPRSQQTQSVPDRLGTRYTVPDRLGTRCTVSDRLGTRCIVSDWLDTRCTLSHL